MADRKQADEPSMEEILSSIRRIIAEDGEARPAEGGGAPAALQRADGPEQAAEPEEVLELTEIVEDDEEGEAARPLAPEGEAIGFETGDEPEEKVMEQVEGRDDIVSQSAASSSTEAMARLARAARGDDAPPVNIAGGDRTLEAFLREMMYPVLKEWLDANLPQIVERVVEQEVKKLARRAELN